MEERRERSKRLPVSEWLRHHFGEIRLELSACIARAASVAHPDGTPRLHDGEDLLHDAVANLLPEADARYPEPVTLRACCKILCTRMLNSAANERRKLLRRRQIGKGVHRAPRP